MFGRPPKVRNILAHPETSLKKIFVQKLQVTKFSAFLTGSHRMKIGREAGQVLTLFDPPCPNPPAAGAPTLGHPKYLVGGHKSPLKHFPQPSPGGSVAQTRFP